MNVARAIRHLLTPHWIVRRTFPRGVLDRIERAIQESEKSHHGELRFAVEAGLDLMPLMKNITPRQRAVEIFSRLRVWDTEHNSGILIYVQLIDRNIEIVADRGINAKVEQETWDAICRRMEAAFRSGDFQDGVLSGIEAVTALLVKHFPVRGTNSDELPNRPVVL